MNLILEASRIAEEAHRGQARKYGKGPYIQHPERVALAMSTAPREVLLKADQQTEELVAAAWLHDVVEDCDPKWLVAIVENMPAPVIKLVAELTDNYTSKSHPHLNREVRKHMESERLGKVSVGAKIIKLADLIDNLQDIPRGEDFFRVMSSEVGRLHDLIGHDIWPEASAYLDTLLHPEWNKP